MDINRLLGREQIDQAIVQLLHDFDAHCHNLQFKKGIYVYGASGSGKTYFVTEILKRLNYDVIKYDAGDTRNKNLIDSITSNNISSNNVLNMMYKKKQKIAILMDEIEAMNSGDKFGITSLIKLIRQKKTKRQKLESQTFNPIICISNYYVDKKIKELMKVCHVFELTTPTPLHIRDIVRFQFRDDTAKTAAIEEHADALVAYIQGDLRKCFTVMQWIRESNMWKRMIATFCPKMFNEDSKRITRRILEAPVAIEDHCNIINETDRTIVALLWHENVVDSLPHQGDITERFGLYHRILQNICFADYIDRITFQNQIWQFNEMSSLIKTMYNNKLFHEAATVTKGAAVGASVGASVGATVDIRFTKILTKYSTEYNNANFVSALCNKMEMDRKDVMCFFQELRFLQNMPDRRQLLQTMVDNVDITKLDIKRFYRYLDQNEKKEEVVSLEEEEEDDEEAPAQEYELVVF